MLSSRCSLLRASLGVLALTIALPASAQQTILLQEDFSAGVLPAGWTHVQGGPNPSCSDVTFQSIGMNGTSIVLASSQAGCQQATGIMTDGIDVSACSEIGLLMMVMNLGDEDDPCPSTWTATSAPTGDCYGYSTDGVNFELHKEFEGMVPFSVEYYAWTTATTGMTTLWFYLAEYDNDPPTDDGISFDDVIVVCDPEETDCANGVDDDFDLWVDCDDPDCATQCGSTEDCVNGIDDDLDELVDCDDPDCQDDPACNPPEDCGNGLDDDNNGVADCDDPACAGFPPCNGEEYCSNGVDDDGDGLADCDDPDCMNEPDCSGEICGNGVDDNANGLSDCCDPDCANDPSCGDTELDCFDGIDNDCDGQTDGADTECEGDDDDSAATDDDDDSAADDDDSAADDDDSQQDDDTYLEEPRTGCSCDEIARAPGRSPRTSAAGLMVGLAFLLAHRRSGR